MGKWIQKKLWMTTVITIQANINKEMAEDQPHYKAKSKQQGSNQVCEELAKNNSR